jgi:hypothetical protein
MDQQFVPVGGIQGEIQSPDGKKIPHPVSAGINASFFGLILLH